MNKNEENQRTFASPEVEVIEAPSQMVICQSNTERPTDESSEWGWIDE